MTRVLFVDDESRVLEGLQRMLRSRRHEWEMVFAADGPAALAACEIAPFDVVVSDMRMPGMDGATLLAEVQRIHPDTVRIVLSGHADRAGAARAARVAHQFLAKPTDAAGLTETIERACQLRDTLKQPAIREVLGRISSLPTIPGLYMQLVELLNRPNTQVEEIAAIIVQDIGMSVKVLQLVNSTMFGISRHITTLQTAVTLLGVNFISSLVLTAEVFRAYETRGTEPGLNLNALQRHSLLVADIAASLVTDGRQAESAYIAGMLHDVGRLALMDGLPKEFAEICRTARDRGVPLYDVEMEVLGVTHTQIGAYLLRLWHLPEAVVEAVAFHHKPSAIGSAAPMIPLAVHVADALANEVAPEFSTGQCVPPELDMECLSRMDLIDQLPAWRAAAQERYGHAAKSLSAQSSA
jgi:putative nucleotidyltransferase with HDIG domain